MSTSKWSRDIEPRTAALVAGFGMLAMAIIAPLSLFGVIENLAVEGDPAATAANLVDSAGLFRAAGVGLLVVAILDVIVAWGLYVLLRPVNPSLSLLAAFFRLAYAAIFVTAINDLFSAVRIAPVDPAETAFFLDSFELGWQGGLTVFGIHLVVLGILVWRAEFIPRLLGALLIIAGVGYVVDGVGTLLSPTYALGLSAFLFVGEVLFLFWLLIRGRKLPAAGLISMETR